MLFTVKFLTNDVGRSVQMCFFFNSFGLDTVLGLILCLNYFKTFKQSIVCGLLQDG